MGNKTKQRVVAWLPPEQIAVMEKLMLSENMKNHTEFVDRAVQFYIGYLGTENSTDYLSKTLIGEMKGTLRETENRQSANIFRLAVEMSMMMNILAAGLEITDEQLYKLRGRCVREVKASKGKVSFEDALEFQRSDD
ncbi:hypothetical protein [Chakrabartyella piscis]|uniref:hypothetical protein n=1 Tax=Chakrabartyella piscis TaxID=2918914 RepID=UPI00295863C9|nr:hypothetical protein [Chakrabartyella piscis]